jgi:hypothetical protein
VIVSCFAIEPISASAAGQGIIASTSGYRKRIVLSGDVPSPIDPRLPWSDRARNRRCLTSEPQQ